MKWSGGTRRRGRRRGCSPTVLLLWLREGGRVVYDWMLLEERVDRRGVAPVAQAVRAHTDGLLLMPRFDLGCRRDIRRREHGATGERSADDAEIQRRMQRPSTPSLPPVSPSSYASQSRPKPASSRSTSSPAAEATHVRASSCAAFCDSLGCRSRYSSSCCSVNVNRSRPTPATFIQE